MTDLTSTIPHQRSRIPGLVDPRVAYASPLLSGLVNYWKLDEASGNRLDSMGISALAPLGTVSQATGKVGSAVGLTIAGTNGLQATGAISTNSARSVACWVYPTDVAAQRGFMSAATSAFSGGPLWILLLRQGGGSGPFSVYHGGNYRNGTTVASANTWYHVVYTYSGSGASNAVELWINGTREVNTAASDANSATLTFIGASFGDFAGRVDEVGVWNRALSSTEIASLYNGGNGVTYPSLG